MSAWIACIASGMTSAGFFIRGARIVDVVVMTLPLSWGRDRSTFLQVEIGHTGTVTPVI